MAIKNKIPKKQLPPPRAGFRWLFVIVVLFSLLLIHAWVRTETTQTMIRITEIEKSLLDATRYQRELQLEIDSLRSEERIRRIAIGQLNLVRDNGENTHYLEKGSDNG